MNPRFAPLSPGTLQRHGRNRARYERPFYGYDFGENIYPGWYLHNLPMDPRMRPMYGHGGGPRGFRARRANSSHEYDSDGEADARQPRPARMDARDTKDSLTFGKAMTNLHQQLVKSAQFYGEFKSGYENDIVGIKKYATEESLLSLWILRVKGKKDPKTAADQDDDDTLMETAEKFPSMKKKLRDALTEALCSTLPEGRAAERKGEIRLEAAKRLKDKVILAHSQILELLDLVPMGYENCDALFDELERLRALLDPDDVKNKELYNGADCEAGGGSGEEGGGAQAQAQWL